MSQAKKAPAYNLKVVLQLTGIKPDTLRAWERRYGLPQPQRTEGGHRLYSQYDIEMIKWLIDRQSEGMRINQAVDLWRTIELEGKDPLDDTHPVGMPASIIEQSMIGTSLSEIRVRWVEACLNYDEEGAEQILSQSFALFSVELVCLEVLLRGIVDIGDLWYRGTVSIQQEHFASELVHRRLEALIAASPPPFRPEKLLVGCPAQEEHVITALLATLFLRRYGYQVTFLGANVPVEDLEKAVESTRARLVILVASQLQTAANLLQSAQKLQKNHIPLAYAGLVFTRQPDLIQYIPGYYLGDRLDRVVPKVEAFLNRPVHIPEAQPEITEYRLLKLQIEQAQLAIKADMMNALTHYGINDATIRLANDAMLRDILAGLILGFPQGLMMEFRWAAGLLKHHGLSSDLLPAYLQAFAQSLNRHVGELAKIIIDWLQSTDQYFYEE